MIDQPESDKNAVQLKLISRKMVHSLNNMLFVISSYSEFIKEVHYDEETAENLQRIRTATDQCQKILLEWREEADGLIPDPPGT